MSEPVNSGQGHQYPSIQLSGNVRAIFGDVYGADGSFFTAAERPTLPLKRQYYEQPHLDEFSRHAARFAAALSQDYEVVSTAMNAVRKLDTDLSRSLKQIRVRHTIFKLTLRSLLVPFTGSAVAYQMLQDSQHAMWAESDFVRYLDDFFGFSSEAVEAILDLISQDLDGIAAMAEVMVCHHGQYGSRQGSVAEESSNTTNSALDTYLKELKEHTEDFRDLIQRCAPELPRDLVTTPLQHATAQAVARYTFIQDAANQFYHAFAKACEEHSSHPARLRLFVSSTPQQRARFVLMLKSQATSVTEVHVDNKCHFSALLNIESQLVESSTQPAVDTQGSSLVASVIESAKRCVDVDLDSLANPAEVRRSGLQRSQVVNPSASATGARTLIPSTLPVSFPAGAFPNFCADPRICCFLARTCHIDTTDLPIGYLDHTGPLKHIVYLQSHTTEPQVQSKSAADPLSETRNEDEWLPFSQLFRSIAFGQGAIHRPDLIRIAKQLSIAVLQYNSTPWLHAAWDNDHVLLKIATCQTASDGASAISPPETYLDVSIQRSPSPVPETPFGPPTSSTETTAEPYVAVGTITPPDDQSPSLIRNSVLFQLGVMLLELAYGCSLSTLQKPQNIYLRNTASGLYATAQRLQKRVSAIMGSEYSQLVRRCIECDFGQGSDLAMPQLQGVFYENVINMLEQMEKTYARLLK